MSQDSSNSSRLPGGARRTSALAELLRGGAAPSDAAKDAADARGALELLRAGAAVPLELRELRGRRLVGEDLSSFDLTGWDLAGADLSRADLSGATLANADLRGAALYEANLTRAELLGADLSDANLSGARLVEAGLGRAVLDRAVLLDADLTGASLSEASCAGVDARRARMGSARCRGLVLRGANLGGAYLKGAELDGSDVSGASFDGADLRGATLRRVVGFRRANWLGVDIREIDFTGAYLCRRFIVDQNYIAEFRRQGPCAEVVYRVWRLTSDCGRSMLRWAISTGAIVVVFAWIYTFVALDYGEYETRLSPIYYSVVTLTTLGYGDVHPASASAQVVAMLQVILGYVMLGGLLSIISNKMVRRAD